MPTTRGKAWSSSDGRDLALLACYIDITLISMLLELTCIGDSAALKVFSVQDYDAK